MHGRSALLASCLLVLLALAPAAGAKGRMTLALGDSSPAVGQPITVSLRVEFTLERDATVRVAAVAPGASMYDVIATVTHTLAGGPAARTPHDGFGVELRRVAQHRWRAFVRFPRAGRWQLVVPNWGGAPGYAMPPPIVRDVRVSVPES
jgi:hypothetical protein